MLIAALCLSGMAAQAQQNLSWGQGPQVASPDVHADNSVTFNLIAPEAQKVQITGDMLPTKKVEFAGNTYDTPGDTLHRHGGKRCGQKVRQTDRGHETRHTRRDKGGIRRLDARPRNEVRRQRTLNSRRLRP